MVTLLCGDKPVQKSFIQAEGLLRGEKQMKHGIWVLPVDSPYIFENNGLIRRPNKGTVKNEAKGSSDTEGAKPREQAEVS